MISQELELHRISDANFLPLPLKKYLETLSLDNVDALNGKTARLAIQACLRDLFHYARVSGTHVLECIVDTSLSLIKREQIEEAGHVRGGSHILTLILLFLILTGLTF